MITVSCIAKYFLYLDSFHDGEGVSNLKLQKLCYYGQGYHLAIYDKPLFSEEVFAWAHGPVIESLYHEYKQCGRNQISTAEGFDTCSLSKESRELLDEVYEVYGQYSAWKLRNMTHEEPPWIDNEASAGLISQQEMKKYFKTRIV